MAKVGRPKKYETPEEMQEIVDRYFEACRANRKASLGAQMTEEEEELTHFTDDSYPTVTGLALALDMNRKTLIEYGENDEFSNTVKRAKARVEAMLEQRLYHQSPTGCIFNLKNNFGWKDKTETEHSGPDGGPIEHSWTIQPVRAKEE